MLTLFFSSDGIINALNWLAHFNIKFLIIPIYMYINNDGEKDVYIKYDFKENDFSYYICICSLIIPVIRLCYSEIKSIVLSISHMLFRKLVNTNLIT